MWKVLSLYKQAHLKLCESWSLTANQQISYLALLVMVTDTIIFPKSFAVPYASNSSKLSFITNSSPQWTDTCMLPLHSASLNRSCYLFVRLLL